MVRTLTQSGNAVCLVIDETILQRLHLAAGDPVDVHFDGQQLIISATNKSAADPEFVAAVAHSNAQYAADFKKLAE